MISEAINLTSPAAGRTGLINASINNIRSLATDPKFQAETMEFDTWAGTHAELTSENLYGGYLLSPEEVSIFMSWSTQYIKHRTANSTEAAAFAYQLDRFELEGLTVQELTLLLQRMAKHDMLSKLDYEQALNSAVLTADERWELYKAVGILEETQETATLYLDAKEYKLTLADYQLLCTIQDFADKDITYKDNTLVPIRTVEHCFYGSRVLLTKAAESSPDSKYLNSIAAIQAIWDIDRLGKAAEESISLLEKMAEYNLPLLVESLSVVLRYQQGLYLPLKDATLQRLLPALKEQKIRAKGHVFIRVEFGEEDTFSLSFDRRFGQVILVDFSTPKRLLECLSDYRQLTQEMQEDMAKHWETHNFTLEELKEAGVGSSQLGTAVNWVRHLTDMYADIAEYNNVKNLLAVMDCFNQVQLDTSNMPPEAPGFLNDLFLYGVIETQGNYRVNKGSVLEKLLTAGDVDGLLMYRIIKDSWLPRQGYDAVRQFAELNAHLGFTYIPANLLARFWANYSTLSDALKVMLKQGLVDVDAETRNSIFKAALQNEEAFAYMIEHDSTPWSLLDITRIEQYVIKYLRTYHPFNQVVWDAAAQLADTWHDKPFNEFFTLLVASTE